MPAGRRPPKPPRRRGDLAEARRPPSSPLSRPRSSPRNSASTGCVPLEQALLDPAGVGDEHGHEPGRRRARRARRGARARCRSEGYCTSATWLVSCESRRTVRASTSSRSADWPRKVSIACRWAGRQRTQVGELVDEDAVALVGGDATGRGVRRRDELFLFEQRHVVADRRRRDAEGVPFDDRLRADRLARGDVVLHDDPEHGEAAFGDHVGTTSPRDSGPSPRSSTPGRLTANCSATHRYRTVAPAESARATLCMC